MLDQLPCAGAQGGVVLHDCIELPPCGELAPIQDLRELLVASEVELRAVPECSGSGKGRGGEFGMGVGTAILVVNALLLSGYTFGCHSLRHVLGGKLDCMTCDGRPTARFSLWNRSTWFNGRHMLFAWLSLVWVSWTDLYIYLVSSGAIHDLNTWD